MISPRAVFLLLMLLGVGAATPQVRDTVTPPAVGTASISGVVVDDEEPARPVRRAVVTLTGEGLRPNRGAITDDEGRFTLRDVPAGRFTLAVERGGFVTSVYGAKRPGRAGTDITIAGAQHIADLRVRLWRGAVLSGLLRDDSGAPLVNTAVAAIPARQVTPVAPTLSNGNEAMTNDLGEFRVFGLEPGTYVVRATSAWTGRQEIAMSEADIDATFAALAGRARQLAPSGVAGSAATPKPLEHTPAAMTVTTAPIYFPGTSVPADATPITLAAGEERSGVDFSVRRVRTATIRGKVVGPDGAPIASAFVQLVTSTAPVAFVGTAVAPVTTTSGVNGSFGLGPIAPGSYTLLARGSVAPASGQGSGSVSGSLWWATAPVSVTGDDVDLSTLILQPGMTVSGRVVFESGTTPPPDATQFRVQMQSASLAAASSQGRGGATPNLRFLQPAAVRADGAFEVTGLVPEDYWLTVTGAAPSESGWWLRAAMWKGRDLLDAPVHVAPRDDISGVSLVFSDRHTELSGTLRTAGGAAATSVFVLAFPADATLRVPQSRRMQAVRPDSSGRFVIKNLPAGEYLLCALTDVEDGEWNDPGFLDPLVAASVKITLANGEKRVQDLQVAGG
jgi:hypothetical protein